SAYPSGCLHGIALKCNAMNGLRQRKTKKRLLAVRTDSTPWRSGGKKRIPESGSRRMMTGGMRLLIGMIGRAHHGAHGRMREAHFVCGFFEHLECVGMHVSRDRQMVRRRLQILTDGEHFEIGRASCREIVKN